MGLKTRINELVAAVNDSKTIIDGYSVKLDQRRQDRVLRGEDETVDNEEFAIVRHVKDAKSVYTKHYEELNQCKLDRDLTTKTLSLSRQQLLSEFERWYQMVYESSNGPQYGSAGPRVGGSSTGLLPVINNGPRPPATRTVGGNNEDENLDEGEWFDLLQMNRVRERDPEAVAYYSAKKVVRSKLSKNGVSAGAGNRSISGTRRN
eukprot:GDKK01058283.1.p1 GENE.GDKK01058283.1~~GDKK01058283.1.p1  ORF type:complete len:205 (+),score=16.85 GDKK01058283.1:1-615(+)